MPKKVLIADDSRFQVQMLSMFLAEKGVEVIAAQDGLQASALAKRALPDAVILDINMPGGSGIEVLKRIRLSTNTQHIPVVVVSGNVDTEVEQSAKTLGVMAFLHKPIDTDELWTTLSTLLSPNAEHTAL
jgi:CheY-like chemotaxis protein